MLGERFDGGIGEFRQAAEHKKSLMLGKRFGGGIGEFRQAVE